MQEGQDRIFIHSPSPRHSPPIPCIWCVFANVFVQIQRYPLKPNAIKYDEQGKVRDSNAPRSTDSLCKKKKWTTGPDNTKMLSYVLCRVKIAISRDVALFENPLPIPFHRPTQHRVLEQNIKVPKTIIYLLFFVVVVRLTTNFNRKRGLGRVAIRVHPEQIKL